MVPSLSTLGARVSREGTPTPGRSTPDPLYFLLHDFFDFRLKPRKYQKGVGPRLSDQSIDHPLTVLMLPFDRISFCKYVNDNGRAYRYQAMKLISICRTISLASTQHDQDDELQR